MSRTGDTSGRDGNLMAVEAISAKLAEVTRLAEKLDARLCEAGARTRPVPISSARSSCTSLSSCLSHATSSTISSTVMSAPSFTIASVPTTVLPMTSSTVTSTNENVARVASTSGVSTDVPVAQNVFEKPAVSSSSLAEDSLKKSISIEIDRSLEENIAEDFNVDGYVTATECSTTPTARSRSASFIASPECEELAAASTTLSSFSTVRSPEQSKITTMSSTFPTAASKKMIKYMTTEIKDTKSNEPKLDITSKTETEPKDSFVSMGKTINENTGKIVKEVTETTTLRVLHDTQFGIASYKVISNTLQDHHSNTDTKEIEDLKHTVILDPQTKTNESSKEENLKKSQQQNQESSTKLLKIQEVCQKGNIQKISKETDEVSSVLIETTRHHEDSGIEMSPMRKDDKINLEEFVENIKKSGEWLQLKVLEVQPELTKLGDSVEAATELSNAHDEVLIRLQSKQSPVEELLRQADQLIVTQRPRAEVYAAMAETLGQAWRNVNELLEHRKQILDNNVLFQCRAEECRDSMRALEMACNDTLLPIEIEAVKNFLSKIHDLRKHMLEALMGALQEGKTLLDRLKEISNEGTLDSRPDRIKSEAEHAVLKVERWLEELHDRRRLIEASFRSRKTQLEQCLALALLATDLRDLEEILNDRIAALSSSCDQLGESASSTELLLFELRKLQTEAKEFQDRSIKITKSTERLVSSGHFAGEQATEQAYTILGAAADYVNDLDQYESLLTKTIEFFNSVRSAITKLDQLEIQLVTTEYPPFSAQLARFHSQTVDTIEGITSKPLAEGYALLDITGRGAPGAEGVKHAVEELENRKIALMERCTAHEKENLEISRIVTTFLNKHDKLQTWLIKIVEAFIQGHQDMGGNLLLARDFVHLHQQMLNDLDKRTDEVEHLEFEILPIWERFDEGQKREFTMKIKDLHASWSKAKSIVSKRIELGSLYVHFHEITEELTKEVDVVENDFKKYAGNLDEAKIEDLNRRWQSLQPLYVKFTASGKKFLDEVEKVDDPYLDTKRACLYVQTLLESFSNRQLIITDLWEKWQITIEVLKERRIEHERKIEESTKTLEWVSKFGEQLYPVIMSESTKVQTILEDLEGSKLRILPELNKAVEELDARIKSINTLVQKGEAQIDEEILKRLMQMYEKLHSTAKNYGMLLESLISVFQHFKQIEHKKEQAEKEAEWILSLRKLSEIDLGLTKFETLKQSISDSLKQIHMDIENLVIKIKQQEPIEAAREDIEKLKRIEDIISMNYESFSMEMITKIEEHRQIYTFREDLEKIDLDLRNLNDQLKQINVNLGENLQVAKSVSTTFVQFEKTIVILEEKIETFIKSTEEKLTTVSPQLKGKISSLRERWKDLKKGVETTKNRLNLSIQYFEHLEKAKEWMREGSKLLVIIARKSTNVKTPQDATDLLQEIERYLKPGEENQNRRIEKIKELSTIVYGTDRLPQFNEVVVENHQMLDSFAIISSELRTLIQNLENADDLREKLRMEKLQVDEKLQAVKEKMAAAEAAKEEAENVRKIAEKLAAETLEKATREVERLKEKKLEIQRLAVPLSSSVSAQTDKVDHIGESVSSIQETITSAITTNEIHILQKVELEKRIPIVQREPSPIKKVISKETEGEFIHKIHKEEESQEKVTVAIKPEFTVPLKDATVQEGEKFTFECRLVGQPKPEVVWYKDGISIINNPDYLTTHVHDACTLTIEETFAEDSAKYTCTAFNTVGSVETSATLTVKETALEEQPTPPVFIKELQPLSATEGSSYQLECIVDGNPLPTVQWYKNDVNIDNSPDYIITYNNGEAILKFEEIFVEDKATYTCKAVNRLGQTSTSAFLNVERVKSSTEKPYFSTSLSNAMARAGQRVKLECEARGTPIPSLTWSHDGKPVEENGSHKIHTSGGRTSLIISEAFPKDAGCYTVIAKNEDGEAVVSCNVSVKGRLLHETSDSEFACSDMEPVVPKIQLPLKDLEVLEGRSATLDCVIVGQPEPEVIWYHNDQPVKESADFQLLFQGDKCSLVIHEAFLDDAGVYKVVAINSGGEAYSQCTLMVLPISRLPKETDEFQKSVEIVQIDSSPKFVKLPTDSVVVEGEPSTFECIIIGEPKPDVKWYSDKREITMNERILIKEEDRVNILKILSTIPEDKGNYTIKATNIHGEVKACARLVVKPLSDLKEKEEYVQIEEQLIPPTFKEIFEDRRIPEGISTKFECIVTGKPFPKVQWMFNDRPIDGKNFLASVSGERQVLTIPRTESAHTGTVSCLAENAIGRAICTARIEIESGQREIKPTDEMHAASSSEKHFSTEKTKTDGGTESQVLTKMSSTITESSTTHVSTKKEFISSTMSSTLSKNEQEPKTVCVKTTMQSSEESTSTNGAPPVVQSHKVEKYEKIVQDQPGEIRQEKTVIVSQDEETAKKDVRATQISKPSRKSTAPRFVSPIMGMIVDQGADVVLEGTIDGFPQPSVSWLKNGQELVLKDGVKTSYSHNHIRLELNNVGVKDAGRYTCTATNEIGSASSTADLVVKKTIFPPVFGKRLQAQVVKRGDRVIMEVEITGTPEPTVTWYKNDVPIKEHPPELRLKQQGNCYILIIEKVEKEHAGKYMVRATNAGGEAQSIADFAVFEPTPDTMVEVHKTVVYENVQDQNISQFDERKNDIHSTITKTKQSSTVEPTTTVKSVPFPTESSSETICSVKTVEEPGMKTSRMEKISSTTETHQHETRTEEKLHMRLEHKSPTFMDLQPKTEQITKKVVQEERKITEPSTTMHDIQKVENENIETSTIAKKDALSFFESFSKETEPALKRPKEMIKLIDDTTGHEIKVEKLTKNYERSTAFQEVKKPEKTSDFQATKKTVQDIFTKLEQGPAPRGVDNKLFDFPYESYNLPTSQTKKTIIEESTSSHSSIHGPTTSSKLHMESESKEEAKGFTLVPEPPPEIGYMPKPVEAKKKLPDISIKAKQLQESFEKTLSPIDAPIGGVKLFPTLPSTPKPPSEPPKITEPFYQKKEIVEEICIKKDAHDQKESKIFKEEKIEPPKFVPTARTASPIRPWSSSSDVETRSHVSTDISEYRCHSAASSHHETMRSTSPRPSADGLAMEKSWAKKYTDTSRKSWPPPESTTTQKQKWQIPEEGYEASSKEFRQEVKEIPGGVQKTSMESSSSVKEKSWVSKDQFRDKVHDTVLPPLKQQPIIYNAETIKVDHTVNITEEQSMFKKYSTESDVHKSKRSEAIEEYNLKNRWMNNEDLKAPSLVKKVETPKKPTVQFDQTLKSEARMESVILEPGPPPEIGYISPPVVKEKKIERIEKSLEMSLEQQPAKIPPGAIRTIPPLASVKKEEPPILPPKNVQIIPPPVPAKQTPLENLEPFPFVPSPTPQSKSVKLPPPPTPRKFVKGSFEHESDYESDYEGHFRAKWRPYESDGEEPRYRRVTAPVPKQPRPKSTEPEPLPPSKFDVPPPAFVGPARPTVMSEVQDKTYKKVVTKKQEKDVKQQKFETQTQSEPIILKPGSPPTYVQPPPKTSIPKSPPVRKPESPKFKTKSIHQDSGYMADTDEPFQQRSSSTTVQKSYVKHEDTSSHMESYESKSQYFESKSSESHQEKKQYFVAPPQVIEKPISQQQSSSLVQKSYAGSSKFSSAKETTFMTDQSRTKLETTKKISAPTPSPSKFVKGEFRESDYESDYDNKIQPVWKPRGAGSEDHIFKPVKANLTSPGKPKEPIAPVLEEISPVRDHKQKDFKRKEERFDETSLITTADKSKTILVPGSPPEIAYAPPQSQTYYESRSGVPLHSAIGLETRKVVRMNEATENSRRVVTVEQTNRVIKFGDQKQDLGMFDSSYDRRSQYRVPTPKKFIQGHFKESDYESDIESSRIRPVWTPVQSDSEDPRYRKVRPPTAKSTRSSSAPVRHEHVASPLEFDTGPPVIKRQSSMIQLRDESKFEKSDSRDNFQQITSRKDESLLRPGSPPKYGFVSRCDVKKAANHVASRHMSDMTNSFKTKTEKFVSDIQSDLKKKSKPILKHSVDDRTSDSDEPRTYTEESRVAEHGTKQIDPETGLIYFKYNFGYEFGIVLPGEGKTTVNSSSKTIQGQRRASDIEMPIVHEFTTKEENGFSKRFSTSDRPSKPTNKFGSLKTVKWEPTSESEFSEVEDARNFRKKHTSTSSATGNIMPPAPNIVIPSSPSPSRWDYTTPSPLSLSPSLPSLSPRYSSATGPPSNVDSAGSPWPTTNGVTSSKEVVQPYLDILPKKAPIFITPLRDIAVVSGQTARFECIVQAEPHPNILWSKNGRIVENSSNYEIHYRNGVCRLAITRAFPEDAGTYACTATNSLGSTVTSATLQVPGNRRSVYAPI